VNGEAFIVAVLDADAKAPLSIAEMRVSKRDLGARYAVEAVQHTARRNARPTAQCRAAIGEVLDLLKSEPLQQHLAVGLRLIAQRRRDRTESAREAERLPMRWALRRAIGDSSFASLLRACRVDILEGPADRQAVPWPDPLQPA